MQAVSRFKRWAGDCVIMTWGTSDILTLIENCRYFSGDEHVPFSRPLLRFAGVRPKTAWAWGGGSRWASPGRRSCWGWTSPAWTTTGALDDSRMTLAILRKVYDSRAIAPYIDRCDGEFYRRVTYKTTYICDIHSPLVEKSHLRFPCPKCGEESRPPHPLELEKQKLPGGLPLHPLRPPVRRAPDYETEIRGTYREQENFPPARYPSPPGRLPPAPWATMELTLPQGVGVLRFFRLEGPGCGKTTPSPPGWEASARTSSPP